MSWLERLMSGWGLVDDQTAPQGDPARIAEVQRVLDGLRPHLKLDSGDVRLLAVGEDHVRLRMVGACASCQMVESTRRELLEPRLRAELPWLREVLLG